MQPRRSTRRWTVIMMVALALLAACGPSSYAQNETSPDLPKQIVQAWKKAGARVGWMSVDRYERLEFYSEKQDRNGEVPAFRFGVWKAGVLAKLPAPATEFGLNLGYTQVTDAGLKELAGLKSLQSLYLHGTKVTGAGLKELAGLKSLQSLTLRFTQVTDAGLKHLAGLKSLQTLDLRSTKVTDAGLKHLAGLKSLQTLNLSFTQVTDAGLKELAGLKSLQTLNLSSSFADLAVLFLVVGAIRRGWQ